MASENNQATTSDEERYERPPSSYGSMKSDTDSLQMLDYDREEEESEEQVAVFALPDPPAPPVVGSQNMHSQYTETLCTVTTQQTKPPGALIIETGSVDLENSTEDDLDDEDEILYTCSPEPPEPLEMEDLTSADENSQPGKMHPDVDLPHVFKSIQSVLMRLNNQEIFKFKMWFNKWEPLSLVQQILDGDVLDFVDKIIEIYGRDEALSMTMRTLDSMGKKEEEEELKLKCEKALFRYHLKREMSRQFRNMREGVVHAGRHNRLNSVYVDPKLSTCAYGGVDPAHEILAQPPTPLQVPGEDTFVSLNNLFRLQKEDGSLVRTVVTTGLPGIGKSVSVAKFSLDWAEECANRDLQYVIKISFKALWHLRSLNSPPEDMSMYEVLKYYYSSELKMKLLEEENIRYLVIMDCFDCYLTVPDWQNAPVIKDNYTKAPIDVLVVNILRGNIFPGACLWILGRSAAVSQIPSQFVDAVTELQGFSDEAIDQYMTIRHQKDNPGVAPKIIRQYKRSPMIHILARHPFLSWIVSEVFVASFRYPDYGANRPRLTPFLIRHMVNQTNRRRSYYRNIEKQSWSDEDRQLLMGMGKLAFKMLEMNTSVFSKADLKEFNLDLNELVVYSGFCTELSLPSFAGKRTFCFCHFTLQEYMAALYVFLMFYLESKNVLESGFNLTKLFSINNKSAAGLVQCALARTLNSKLGQFDMFLRYLCGLLSLHCQNRLLQGYMYPHRSPKVEGLAEVEKLLEQTSRTAPPERVQNLYECIRELTQRDD